MPGRSLVGSQHKHGTMGGARGPTGRDPPVRRKPNSFHEFFPRSEWDVKIDFAR